MPHFSAETVMGVPCWSEPPTIRTSFPRRRLYLLNMSGGRSDPARCPRWMVPLEYGQAMLMQTFDIYTVYSNTHAIYTLADRPVGASFRTTQGGGVGDG